MSEYLQSLLEKINREGVEKAQCEAERILSEAKAKASQIVKEAGAAAEKTRADALKASEDYAKRAEETIRQSARDVVLSVETAIKTKLESLLRNDAAKALDDEALAVSLVKEALKDVSGGAEIVSGAKLAAALKSQLAGEKNIEFVLDESSGTGFSVKQDGGRIENSFTPEVIAGELAKRLRPDLAALLK